jgi:imidazole glycerol phosphate synthase glutamine amidotransferase subunit
MSVAIIDLGLGNIASVQAVFQKLGVSHRRIKSPQEQTVQEPLVLPGQGRFGQVMTALRQQGWEPPLKRLLEDGTPFLGICIGMQVLYEDSEEDPGVAGLGLFSGHVQALDLPKTPVMGWARVHWQGVAFSDGDAYFVNSYAVDSGAQGVCAHVEAGRPFAAACGQKRLLATQFHPEKSSFWGQEVVRQWMG